MNDFDSNIPLLKALVTLTYSNIKAFEKHLADINRNAVCIGSMILIHIINFLLLKTTFWNRQSLRELVFKVHVNCEDIFESCSFKNEKEKCCSIFKPIYTEQGFCYAFNSRYYGTGFSE